MKKLISLFLTLALLSTLFVVGATTASAEETPTYFYGSTVETNRTNSMEWILVKNGDTQTFVKNVAGSSGFSISNDYSDGARWLLLKINIGRGWTFSETTSSVLGFHFYKVYSGTTTAYVIPSKKADWTKVESALESGLTGTDKLAVPTTTEAVSSDDYAATATKYNKKCEVKLATDDLGACYNEEDGCLYMTIAVTKTSTSSPVLPRTKDFESDDAYHYLKLYGTQVVDDFSDSVITWNNGEYTVTTTTTSGTAMLIAASFNGTTMVDAKVATIDATTAEDGVISGTIEGLAEGTVKIFLWDSTTLTPAISVTETN